MKITATIVAQLALLMAIALVNPLAAKSPVDEEGRVIDFARDVAPILKANCLECHGPEDAKNDFRVDDPEIMADYIEAGDAQASSIYIDYIVSDDPDMMMPPESSGGPLSPAEIAIIRVWLNEGADRPEDYEFVAGAQPAAEAKPQDAAEPRGLASRVWGFQGYLHPATVHFPVALLLFGAIFVVLGWKWPQLAHPIPMACLIGGALSAVASSAMGWALAEEAGWGASNFSFDKAVTRHRWLGIAVTVASIAFSLIAIKAELKNNLRLRKVWQVGLLLCASVVGIVGHVGGELTYGASFYEKAFDLLWGTEPEVAKAQTDLETGAAAEPEQVSIVADE